MKQRLMATWNVTTIDGEERRKRLPIVVGIPGYAPGQIEHSLKPTTTTGNQFVKYIKQRMGQSLLPLATDRHAVAQWNNHRLQQWVFHNCTVETLNAAYQR